jgi:hypothetical protein
MKRVAIYIRVSTSKQDTDNQRREIEAVAKRSGWQVVKVYRDAGISGAKGRDHPRAAWPRDRRWQRSRCYSTAHGCRRGSFFTAGVLRRRRLTLR